MCSLYTLQPSPVASVMTYSYLLVWRQQKLYGIFSECHCLAQKWNHGWYEGWMVLDGKNLKWKCSHNIISMSTTRSNLTTCSSGEVNSSRRKTNSRAATTPMAARVVGWMRDSTDWSRKLNIPSSITEAGHCKWLSAGLGAAEVAEEQPGKWTASSSSLAKLL